MRVSCTLRSVKWRSPLQMVPSPSFHVSTLHSLPSTISNHSWLLLLYREIHTLHTCTCSSCTVEPILSVCPRDRGMLISKTKGGAYIVCILGWLMVSFSLLTCPYFRVVWLEGSSPSSITSLPAGIIRFSAGHDLKVHFVPHFEPQESSRESQCSTVWYTRTQ